MIFYRAGYKYQLAEDYSVYVPIATEHISADFLELAADGRLTILHGYAWDGPSGPAMDTPSAMRGSLVHDALYQLMRMGLLPQSARKDADREYRKLCQEDGMSGIRAWYHFRGLRWFAGNAADPSHARPILVAP